METLDAQSEEQTSRQAQAGRERGKRERLERLESALKEFDKLKASKSRVERVSTSDADARVMKQAEGGSAPSYNVHILNGRREQPNRGYRSEPRRAATISS